MLTPSLQYAKAQLRYNGTVEQHFYAIVTLFEFMVRIMNSREEIFYLPTDPFLPKSVLAK